jgi:hypothetical protein
VPTHHLHDSAGRPLFTTMFLTSYALTAVGHPPGAAHDTQTQ